METVLLGVVIFLQVVQVLSSRKVKKGLYAEIRTLYGSIARDLNAITSTIAIYTGHSGGGQVIPLQNGENLTESEKARQKAEIWGAYRTKRG